MKKPQTAAVTLVLALAACLENEETIDVAPDGSVTVELRSCGDVADLADGYPLPVEGDWEPRTEATELWRAGLAPGANARAMWAGLAERWKPGWNHNGPTLAVRRTFASVDELPTCYAPSDDPYRTAYLGHEASLEVHHAGARKVYVFERTFRARGTNQQWELARRWETELPDSLDHRFGKADETLGDFERYQIADLLRTSMVALVDIVVRDALVGIWTDGDGSLPAGSLDGILRRVIAETAPLVDVGLVQRWHDYESSESDESLLRGGDLPPHPLDTVEREMRAILRKTLTDELTDRGVPETTLNAVLFAAERSITHNDATNDLMDETFVVRVGMPGTIVAGNYGATDFRGRAEWRFQGVQLDRDMTLRVVSVVD